MATLDDVRREIARRELDRRRIEKSQHAQDAARTASEAEDELAEPSTTEKVFAFGQGLADAASLGSAGHMRGVAATAADLPPPLQAALLVPGAAPLFGEALRLKNLVAPDPESAYSRARTDQEEKSAAASEGKRGGAYGSGHLAGDLTNAAMGVAAPIKNAATAAREIVAGTPASQVLRTGFEGAPAALRSLLARVSKIDEGPLAKAVVDTVPGGKLAVGLAKKMNVAPAAPTASAPEWLTSLLEESAGPAAPSGLELAEMPAPPTASKALVKFLEPVEAAAKKPAPLPADALPAKRVRPQDIVESSPVDEGAAVSARALEKLGEGEGVLAYPDAMPGEPGYGERIQLDALRRLIPTPEPIPSKPIGSAGEVPAQSRAIPTREQFARLPEAEQKAVIRKLAADRSMSLQKAAAALGVAQGDIGSWFKAAQLGNL